MADDKGKIPDGKKPAGNDDSSKEGKKTALAAYKSFLEAQHDTKNIKNSLLISLCVFIAAFFIVFPDIAAKIIGADREDDVIEIRKQTVIKPKQQEQKQFREVKTEQRQREFSQIPALSRPTGDERIVEDITDLELEVNDEMLDDLLLGGLPDTTPGPILVAGDIEKPVYIPRGTVPYPKKAEILRRTGRVQISVVITKDGRLEDIEVLGENPPDFGFGDAALMYLRQCEWRPARQNGKPIYARYNFTFLFKLQK